MGKLAAKYPDDVDKIPSEPPAEHKRGRRVSGINDLSEAERFDLLTYIKFHERCAATLSIAEVRLSIAVMRAVKHGWTRDSQEDHQEVLAWFDADRAWRSFKEWVARTQPLADRLAVSKLRAQTSAALRQCTKTNVLA